MQAILLIVLILAALIIVLFLVLVQVIKSARVLSSKDGRVIRRILIR